jgi:hypothetical protein
MYFFYIFLDKIKKKKKQIFNINFIYFIKINIKNLFLKNLKTIYIYILFLNFLFKVFISYLNFIKNIFFLFKKIYFFIKNLNMKYVYFIFFFSFKIINLLKSKNYNKLFFFNYKYIYIKKNIYKSLYRIKFLKYRSENFYLFFTNFLILKNIIKLLNDIEDEKKIFNILRILISLENKDFNKKKNFLNLFDILKGKKISNYISLKPNILYSKYLAIKEYEAKKEILKYKKKKNKYFILLELYKDI